MRRPAVAPGSPVRAAGPGRRGPAPPSAAADAAAAGAGGSPRSCVPPAEASRGGCPGGRGDRCSWGSASAAADPEKGPGVRSDARQLLGARVPHSLRDSPRGRGGGADLPPSPLREVSFAFPASRGQHLQRGRTGPLGAPPPGPQRFPAGARGATPWRRRPPRRPGAAAASPGNQGRVACYVRKSINTEKPEHPVSVGVTVGWVTRSWGVCGGLLGNCPVQVQGKGSSEC